VTGSILSTLSKEFSYRRVLALEDIPACRFDLWYAGTAEPVRRSSQSQRRKEKARVREDFWNAGSEIPRHCCDILLDQTRMRTRSLLLVPFLEITELDGRFFTPLRYNSKVVEVFLALFVLSAKDHCDPVVVLINDGVRRSRRSDPARP